MIARVIAVLDETLEAFLRSTAALSAVDVDVSFDPPDDEWAAKLTRPTVNLYLWDIRRSVNRAITGVEEHERDGVTYRRMALPRVEFRYCITVWTTEHDDERALLSSLMIALLGHAEVPATYLVGPLREYSSPRIQMVRAGDGDVYSFMTKMKVTLQFYVVTPVDTGPGTPLAPQVSELALGVTDTDSGASDIPVRRIAGECSDPAAIGATVRSPVGETTVNEFGRFLINARPGDEIVVATEPPQTAVTPDVGGVLVGS